jgi:uncharacterized protein with HEPN domain
VSRSDEERAVDILEAADFIAPIVSRGWTDFEEDIQAQFAMMHLVQQIGEAARVLTPEFKQQFPDIQWRAIIAMRNILVHAYHRVSVTLVWDTATNHIPALARTLRAIETSD